MNRVNLMTIPNSPTVIEQSASLKNSVRLPALFIGHGSPLAAFEDNQYTRGWIALANEIPQPRAILCISAHWYTHGTGVTAMPQPRTIHDFYGFPQALYEYSYPAPGDLVLAQRVAELLAPTAVIQDQQWGLDHGCWTVLKHMYPQANIPVLQLSIDGTRNAAAHYQMGQHLAPLRDAGVLILGTGNVVHNLRYLQRGDRATALPWAVEFNRHVRESIENHDHDALIQYERFGESAAMSVPTPDHYLPLLYTLGASYPDEPIKVLFDDGAIAAVSMLSVKVG